MAEAVDECLVRDPRQNGPARVILSPLQMRNRTFFTNERGAVKNAPCFHPVPVGGGGL